MGMFDLKGYSIRNLKSENLNSGRFSMDPGKRALSASHWVLVGHEYK